ncbi:MAG: SAM-dependent methyltransferase [Candidatus Nanoarchaeia archaeon]|nr:SAM-dependent methyltransferase [Candidatus Nanoarchaeia archaeon]
MKVILEHMEKEVFKWCQIEYKHISKIIGKDNLIFTNIQKKYKNKLNNLGEVNTKSVKGLNIKRLCVLDPRAKKVLSPEDGKLFDYFVFGGILGSEIMGGRTKKELKIHGVARRNLGKVQMPTDIAVLVTKKIIKNKIPFSKLKFKDEIEIPIKRGISTILPYRYLIEKGKVILAPGLKDYLRKEDSFD